MEQNSVLDCDSVSTDRTASVLDSSYQIAMVASSKPENAQDEHSFDFADALTDYAARTMTSCPSAFSSAQLAKFRAARMEEMFPDEVRLYMYIIHAYKLRKLSIKHVLLLLFNSHVTATDSSPNGHIMYRP